MTSESSMLSTQLLVVIAALFGLAYLFARQLERRVATKLKMVAAAKSVCSEFFRDADEALSAEAVPADIKATIYDFVWAVSDPQVGKHIYLYMMQINQVQSEPSPGSIADRLDHLTIKAPEVARLVKRVLSKGTMSLVLAHCPEDEDMVTAVMRVTDSTTLADKIHDLVQRVLQPSNDQQLSYQRVFAS